VRENPERLGQAADELAEVVRRALLETAKLQELEQRANILHRRYSTIIPQPDLTDEPVTPLPNGVVGDRVRDLVMPGDVLAVPEGVAAAGTRDDETAALGNGEKLNGGEAIGGGAELRGN
jgi:hypothetical protein